MGHNRSVLQSQSVNASATGLNRDKIDVYISINAKYNCIGLLNIAIRAKAIRKSNKIINIAENESNRKL